MPKKRRPGYGDRRMHAHPGAGTSGMVISSLEFASSVCIMLRMGLKKLMYTERKGVWQCLDCGWESEELDLRAHPDPPHHNCPKQDEILFREVEG